VVLEEEGALKEQQLDLLVQYQRWVLLHLPPEKEEEGTA